LVHQLGEVGDANPMVPLSWLYLSHCTEARKNAVILYFFDLFGLDCYIWKEPKSSRPVTISETFWRALSSGT